MTKSVHKPTIKRRDMDAVLSCLVDETIGPGECSESLARTVAVETGMAGGIAVREYGRAMSLVIEALGLQPGSKVLVSILAPELYRRTLESYGLVPLYADVDPDRATLDRVALSGAQEQGVEAIILDAPLGIAPDASGFADSPIPIIEDVSYALGARCGDFESGSCGRFVLMHLEEDSVITAGGGALVLAQNRRSQRDIKSAAEAFGDHARLGNLNASLALTQFKHRREFEEKRAQIAEIYTKALAPGKHSVPGSLDGNASSHARFPVVLHGSLREAAKYARAKGVTTEPAFERSIYATGEFDGSAYPNASALVLRCLLFPLYPMLKRDEIESIARVLATLP